jgi:hypothetical protein
MAAEIKETRLGGNLRDFLNVVDLIYRDDPCYVRELDLDVRSRLSPRHPFFEHAEGIIFTAHRAGRCVGRCTAQIDRLHLERHRDDAGFFGFLDTIDDLEVAQGLLDAAAHWLAARGMKRMRGPFMLNRNDQLGCLVEGFEDPPMFMMPHHRPYQGGLIEQAGLPKLIDAYAWRYQVGDIPQRAQKAHDAIAAMPEVKSRPVDMKHLHRDVGIIMDVYNDAWQDGWGYVPITEAEFAKLVSDFKLIARPEITLITEIEGEPAAVVFATPNLNEAIRDLGGKLFPTGILKLLWRTKIQRPKTARLVILGIRKRYRHVKKYAGLSTYLYVQANNAGKQAGFRWGELSFTLEDNHPVNLGIKFMGGKIYKRYRVYEKEL